MKIEILGTGCKSCDTLFQNAAHALEKTGLASQYQLSKTDDIDYFAKMGVFTTPGLVIEGELISAGQILSQDRIAQVLTEKARDKK